MAGEHCITLCRYRSGASCQTSEWFGKNVIPLSLTFMIVMPDRLVGAFVKPLISWDLHHTAVPGVSSEWCEQQGNIQWATVLQRQTWEVREKNGLDNSEKQYLQCWWAGKKNLYLEVDERQQQKTTSGSTPVSQEPKAEWEQAHGHQTVEYQIHNVAWSDESGFLLRPKMIGSESTDPTGLVSTVKAGVVQCIRNIILAILSLGPSVSRGLNLHGQQYSYYSEVDITLIMMFTSVANRIHIARHSLFMTHVKITSSTSHFLRPSDLFKNITIALFDVIMSIYLKQRRTTLGSPSHKNF